VADPASPNQIALVCPFCGVTTAGEVAPDGYLVICGHPHGNLGPPCPGAGHLLLRPREPADCPTCGSPLSLAVRSREAAMDRRHRHDECLRALRERIEFLEAAFRFRHL
jgi:hypothetical protein